MFNPLNIFSKLIKSGNEKELGRIQQIVKKVNLLEKDLEILAAYDRIKFPPRGRKGGENGKAGSIKIKNGRNLKGKGTQLINAGEILVVETPGGGGYGPYKKRSKKLSILDKENELS